MRKVVLITGASYGLGAKLAIKYGENGYYVAINYNKNKEKAENVVKILKEEAICFKADVSNFNEVKQMVEKILDKWERIDILINNAGITYDALLLKTNENMWQKIIDVNLKGYFNCIKAVTKMMINQNEGHIINISSIAGIKGKIGQVSYAASKAGIIGLSKSLAKELGQYNIKINVILPGYMKTEMGEKVNKKIIEKIKKNNVLNRFSDFNEITNFIVYLTQTQNISGQIFNLDSRII